MRSPIESPHLLQSTFVTKHPLRDTIVAKQTHAQGFLNPQFQQRNAAPVRVHACIFNCSQAACIPFPAARQYVQRQLLTGLAQVGVAGAPVGPPAVGSVAVAVAVATRPCNISSEFQRHTCKEGPDIRNSRNQNLKSFYCAACCKD